MKKAITLLLLLTPVFITYINANINELDTLKNNKVGTASFEVIYNYTVKTTSYGLNQLSPQNKQELYTVILQGNNSASKFWDYNLFKRDSLILYGNDGVTEDDIKRLNYLYNYKVKYLFMPIILKGYLGNAVTVVDEITPNDYLYKENTIKLDWELKKDTMTICGYKCYKAESTYGGREWIAWFTPEIAVSDGPWKLSGLPGLILGAYDKTESHDFEAISIRPSNRVFYLEKNALRINTDRKKFIENKNKFENNPAPANNVPMNQINSLEVMMGGEITLINGKRANMKRTNTYSPLELE